LTKSGKLFFIQETGNREQGTGNRKQETGTEVSSVIVEGKSETPAMIRF
jgi:hypothetical protein